ncbi:MAG: PepSY-like domain-containing protein [Flavobacteriales bacterium]|nr:PepSY-like domain-containing protein [Flavobacteriales bacterium]
MKKLTVTAVIILISGYASFAQKATTPKNVQDAFNKKFPSAKEVKWDKENAKEWEAEFEMNGKEYSANFTVDGKWQETEHAILKSEIPTPVKKT